NRSTESTHTMVLDEVGSESPVVGLQKNSRSGSVFSKPITPQLLRHSVMGSITGGANPWTVTVTISTEVHPLLVTDTWYWKVPTPEISESNTGCAIVGLLRAPKGAPPTPLQEIVPEFWTLPTGTVSPMHNVRPDPALAMVSGV